MKNQNIENSKLLAELLSEARCKIGFSQDYMAMSLGISKNTVYNFEKGVSSPNVKQFKDWFETLGLNPVPYYYQYLRAEKFKGISAKDTDEKIEEALIDTISSLSPEDKRGLLYILFGTHGSDPHSVIQMIVADMHTPMSNRVNIARTIIDNYEIAESRGELVETDHIMPDMDNLKSAVEKGKQAAIKGNKAYTNVD